MFNVAVDFKIKVLTQKMISRLAPYIFLLFICENGRDGVHGYQIIRYCRKKFAIYLSPSSVYPVLQWLENEGYIKGKWEFNGNRPRKIYFPTLLAKKLLIELERVISSLSFS